MGVDREQFESFQQTWGTGEGGFSRDSGGLQFLDYSEPPRVVRLTSTGSAPYSGVPQYFDGSTWADLASSVAPSLSDIYELSGSTSVPTNTRVIVYRNPAGAGWVFSTGSSLSLTVKESDGTPSYSGISSLEFDQADGFSLSQPGSGRAKVNYGITVKESDGTPTYSPVNSLEFDSLDFVVTQPGSKRANVRVAPPPYGNTSVNALTVNAAYGATFYPSSSSGVLDAGVYVFNAQGMFTSRFDGTSSGIGLVTCTFYNLTTATQVSTVFDMTAAYFGTIGTTDWYAGAAWNAVLSLSAGDEITVEYKIDGDPATKFAVCGCQSTMCWFKLPGTP